MPANPDFRDLFAALNDVEVRYLVVGAYAVIHHSEPRYTKDLDIWIEPSPKNASRALKALRAFGAPVKNLSVKDLCNPGLVYQMGLEPNRIDILMGVGNLEFSSAWQRAESATYGEVPIRVLSLDDLIATKRECGRPQHLLDVERLEKVHQGKE